MLADGLPRIELSTLDSSMKINSHIWCLPSEPAPDAVDIRYSRLAGLLKHTIPLPCVTRESMPALPASDSFHCKSPAFRTSAFSEC
jgi:hypothetical protein